MEPPIHPLLRTPSAPPVTQPPAPAPSPVPLVEPVAMRKCPKCGQEVGEDEKFCHSCGAQLVEARPARAPVCDVCSKKMTFEDGYVLSTTQVATSEKYWKFAFTHQWSHTHDIDPEGNIVAMLAQQQAGQSTGWLLCESCIELFNVDRKAAKEYAKIAGASSHPGEYCPPGGGPANPVAVAVAAAKAWKELYGKSPRSIR